MWILARPACPGATPRWDARQRINQVWARGTTCLKNAVATMTFAIEDLKLILQSSVWARARPGATRRVPLLLLIFCSRSFKAYSNNVRSGPGNDGYNEFNTGLVLRIASWRIFKKEYWNGILWSALILFN